MIGYADRTLLVGMTTSGKSELANWLWSQLAVRRVCVDSKREFWIDGVRPIELRAVDVDERAGFPRAREEVDAIDWTQPIVHVRHAPLGETASRGQLTALFDAIDRIRGPVNVLLHELYLVSSASWAPPGLRRLYVAGAAKGHGAIACTQRPRNVAKEAITEASHVFLFGPLDAEDVVESRRGLPFLTAERALAWMQQVPEYGYLWADRKARAVAIGDPLPNEHRLATARLIRRRELVAA